MKFYIIQINEYNFNGYTYINSNINDFYEKVNIIENNSVIVTDLFNDNDELLWFNNRHFYNKKDKLNKIIKSKRILMFKLKEKSVKNYYYLEFIKDILSNNFSIFDINFQEFNINKFLGKVKDCIVVANGNKLCKTPDIIDSKDFVVRMNSARVKGFEDKVGSKTNLYFKGKSRGSPDFEGINFSDPNMIALTSQKIFYYDEAYWNRQPFVVKLNWCKLFRKHKFNILKEPNFFMKSNFSKKYNFNTSGQYILILMLYYSIVFGFKLHATGFDLHSKWKDFCQNNTEAMTHCDPDGHYYGEDPDNFHTEPQNMKEIYNNMHHIEETRHIYKILTDNELIYDES